MPIGIFGGTRGDFSSIRSRLNAPTGSQRYSARVFSPPEIEQVQALIRAHPQASRQQLSYRVCELFGWRKADGGLKDMSCRVALLRMHREGLIERPPALHKVTPCRSFGRRTAQAEPEALLEAAVHELGELRLLRVERQASALWNEYIERYHYLGYKPLAGAPLRYFAYARERLVGLLGFGAAAWKTGPRDAWIGWSREQRRRNLGGVVNNARSGWAGAGQGGVGLSAGAQLPRAAVPMKDPRGLEIEQSEVEQLIRKAEQGTLDGGEQKRLVPLLKTLLWLQHTLLESRISLSKLKRLLFGKKTEKPARKPKDRDSGEDGGGSDDGAGSDRPPGDSPKPSGGRPASGQSGASPAKHSRGHGRRAAVDSPGAETVICPHEAYQRGERCPLCGRGRLYRPAPLVRLRFTGQPLALVRRFELERLRCATCGALWIASMPPESPRQTYDVTLKVNLALTPYPTLTPPAYMVWSFIDRS